MALPSTTHLEPSCKTVNLLKRHFRAWGYDLTGQNQVCWICTLTLQHVNISKWQLSAKCIQYLLRMLEESFDHHCSKLISNQGNLEPQSTSTLEKPWKLLWKGRLSWCLTACTSMQLARERQALESSPAVLALREAGAILVGKTTCHELGIGMTGINPATGTAKNPYDSRCSAGGAASGCAAVVSAGLCAFAIGDISFLWSWEDSLTQPQAERFPHLSRTFLSQTSHLPSAR